MTSNNRMVEPELGDTGMSRWLELRWGLPGWCCSLGSFVSVTGLESPSSAMKDQK